MISKTQAKNSLFHKLKMFLLVVGIFVLGALSTLFEHNDQTYVKLIGQKVKQTLISDSLAKDLQNSIISSSRYELKVSEQFKISGEYQLAIDSGQNLYALDRHSGELYQFKNSYLHKAKLIRNLYADLNLPIDQVGLQPPLAMDIHIAFDQLFLSAVLQGIDCHYLALIKTNLKNTNQPPHIFFKTPCVSDQENPVMWGGRFTSNHNQLFISVGEQRFDRSGFPKANLLVQNKLSKNVFGSVIQFDRSLSSWQIFAKGMRNAQGLYWDPETKTLFESEHGPNGGDEINILEKGNNYGWPLETFGKPYKEKFPSLEEEINLARDPRLGVDKALIEFGAKSGLHENFSKPIFSWIPGVGAGSILKIPTTSPLLDWRGDLLVAHMGTNQLHRLRIVEDQIILDEEILIGFRIRDMIVDKNGFIYLALDEGMLIKLSTFDSIKY